MNNMQPNIVVFGGGVQAQCTIDIIEKEDNYTIIGIIDSKAAIGSSIYGYKVIGRQEQLKVLKDNYSIYGGIISVGDNWIRKIIHDDIVKYVPDFTFINAIHPSTIIGNNVEIGKGVMVMAGCIINPGAVIKDFTFFATGAQIEHDCIIHDFASVSAGSVTGGLVEIGKYSAITLGVTIIDRITIGENSVIGSGSLIMKDVPDNVLVYGVPGKIIKERKPYERFLK